MQVQPFAVVIVWDERTAAHLGSGADAFAVGVGESSGPVGVVWWLGFHIVSAFLGCGGCSFFVLDLQSNAKRLGKLQREQIEVIAVEVFCVNAVL